MRAVVSWRSWHLPKEQEQESKKWSIGGVIKSIRDHGRSYVVETDGGVADYPALSVDRAGGGNPLYAEDTPNQEFLIWCAPIQEFLIRCTPIQEFEFTDSVLVFVRGVIWHQEGYYCYIISQMNTFIINKILPRKCLPLLTACRHL